MFLTRFSIKRPYKGTNEKEQCGFVKGPIVRPFQKVPILFVKASLRESDRDNSDVFVLSYETKCKEALKKAPNSLKNG